MKRDASWLREGSFGLMTHYMIHTAPRRGEKITDWNRMVDGFDVERYADDIAGTGASWTSSSSARWRTTPRPTNVWKRCCPAIAPAAT